MLSYLSSLLELKVLIRKYFTIRLKLLTVRFLLVMFLKQSLRMDVVPSYSRFQVVELDLMSA